MTIPLREMNRAPPASGRYEPDALSMNRHKKDRREGGENQIRDKRSEVRRQVLRIDTGMWLYLSFLEPS